MAVQIMKKLILFTLLLALSGGGYWVYRTRYSPAKKEKAAPLPVTAPVETRTLRRTVESTGEVRPENRLEVKPPISGRLESLLVQEGDTVQKGQIIAWISSTDRATLLDTARAKGEAELKYWEEVYKAAPLVAPMTGTVIVRAIEPGQTLTSGNAVVVIADRLIVVGQVDETDIGSVVIGQRVSVQLDAYPKNDFEGTVRSIAYDSKVISNVTTYEVDVLPADLPPFARSGMTATLTFILEEHPEVPCVPSAALEYRGGNAFVRLPGPEGAEPETRAVKTGLREESFTEITEGLTAGETVLIPQIVRKKDNGSNPFLMSRPGSTRNSGSRPQGGNR